MSAPCRLNRRLRGLRRGQAMIVAILGLMVLMASAIALTMTSRLELRIARRGVDDLRREALLKGQVNRGIALIEQGRSDPTQLLESLRTYRAPQWQPLAGEEGEPAGQVALQLVDCSSRLNLNSISQDDLKKLPDMDPETAAAIVRWRDGDKGEDDEDYADRPRPYTPKDRPFDTLEELLLVGGVNREQFFGEPVVEATRQMKQPPLSELLTVYSGENNADAAGNARADLRTATAQELVDAANRDTPLVTQKQAKQLAEAAAKGSAPSTVAEALQTASIDRKRWGPVMDAWTVDRREVLPNKVNLNTAPAAVLGKLPGMNRGLLDAVIEERTKQPEGLTWTTFLELVAQHSTSSMQELIYYSLMGNRSDVSADLGDDSFNLYSRQVLRSFFQQPNQDPNQALVQAIGQLEPVVSFRSCYYQVRVLMREAGSRRTDAVMATIYVPASSDEPAKIVQWRRPDRYPGWTAWFRPLGETEGMSSDH